MIKSEAKTLRKEISWNFLVKKFNKKYIPGVAKDKLAIEFQDLKQDHLTVLLKYKDMLRGWCQKRRIKQKDL